MCPLKIYIFSLERQFMETKMATVRKFLVLPPYLYMLFLILVVSNPALSESRALICTGSWNNEETKLIQVQFRDIKNSPSGATRAILIDSEKTIIMSEKNNIKWNSSRIVFGSKLASGEYFQETKKIRLVIKSSWVASLIFEGECEMSYLADF